MNTIVNNKHMPKKSDLNEMFDGIFEQYESGKCCGFFLFCFVSLFCHNMSLELSEAENNRLIMMFFNRQSS